MLNFERGNRAPQNGGKEPAKPGLKPPIYDPPAPPTATQGGAPTARPAAPGAAAPATSTAIPGMPGRADPASAPGPAAAAPAPAPARHDSPESKLHVGVNIKLKGVEISDCDVLVIEGSVEATVHSKTMEVGEPGTLKGTALIDVAEITGEFTGELTARTRLVVHSTGRVSGTIRYGKLVVEEGGELSGDVQRISDRDEKARPAADVRLGLSRELATGA